MKTAMQVKKTLVLDAPELPRKVFEARKLISDRKSLKQLCVEVGISPQYWYDIEKDQIRGALDIENLRKMEKALGVKFGVSFEDAD